MKNFFSLVKENYNIKWIDLYNQCIEGYEKKGIGYIKILQGLLIQVL